MPWNALNTIKNKNPTGGLIVNWVAVGDGSIISNSINGTSWSGVPVATRGNLTRGRGVAYGKDGNGAGLWVAVGDGTPSIVKSSDGNKWSPVDASGGLTTAYGVAYGKDNLGAGLWVAVGDGKKIATSPDGNIWTAVPADSLGGFGTGRGIAYGNGRWVAVSPGGSAPIIVTSITGKSWAATAPYGTLGSNAYSVAYGNGVWVVVGNAGGKPVVKSPSGTAWSDASTISYVINTLYGVAYGNGRWVTLGDTGGSNKIYSSITDGDTWVASADPGSFTSYTGLGVAYGNGLWVAVGNSTPQCMVTSNNGTNWNAVPVLSLGGLTSGYGVAFKNEII